MEQMIFHMYRTCKVYHLCVSCSDMLCLLRLPDCEYDLPQVPHVKRLPPVCIISCLLRCPDSVNDFPHVSHVKGLTPVCVIL